MNKVHEGAKTKQSLLSRGLAIISVGVIAACLGFFGHKLLLEFAVTVSVNVLNPGERAIDLSHLSDQVQKALEPLPVFSVSRTLICDLSSRTPYAVNSTKVELSACGNLGWAGMATVRRRLSGIMPAMELVVQSNSSALVAWMVLSFAFGIAISIAISQILTLRSHRLCVLVEAQALAQVSAQVAHDIRSPLSALNLLLKHGMDLRKADQQTAAEAINSINQIADDLLDRRRQVAPQMEEKSSDSTSLGTPQLSSDSHELKYALVQCLEAKAIELSTRPEIRFTYDLIDDIEGVFTPLHPTELKRIVSNLINNSAEAIVQTGFISVIVIMNDRTIGIEIRDSGIGMPSEILNRVGRKPVTSGKPKGNGLGLFHAITSIRHLGGEVGIKSELNLGTTIRIQLPKISLRPISLPVTGETADGEPGEDANLRMQCRSAHSVAAFIKALGSSKSEPNPSEASGPVALKWKSPLSSRSGYVE